jgi:hypothetical protein
MVFMVNGPSPMTSPPKIRCRQIGPRDIDAVIELLMRGFPSRSRDHWMRGLDRHAERPVAEGLPRFGYILEADGAPVGVLLVLVTSACVGGETVARCNLSSWYVEPEFRSWAPLLMQVAVRLKNVTYVNVSPSKRTWPIIEALGFSSYCEGLFTALPALGPSVRGVRIRQVKPGDDSAQLPAPERDLLSAHAHYGWLSLVCSTPDGGDHPFIFQPFRLWRMRLPGMRLIYCRDLGDFVRFAGPLGRYLLRHGIPWVMLDSNGPVKGLVGIFQKAGGRKYFKGPDMPRLGDLAFTELALFGP